MSILRQTVFDTQVTTDATPITDLVPVFLATGKTLGYELEILVYDLDTREDFRYLKSFSIWNKLGGTPAVRIGVSDNGSLLDYVSDNFPGSPIPTWEVRLVDGEELRVDITGLADRNIKWELTVNSWFNA